MTAGKLIDACGLKGERVGGARISEIHANYIVNVDNATASDVLALIDIVRGRVNKEYSVELETDIVVKQ